MAETHRYVGSKYWILVEDKSTRMKWSIFIKNKDEMGEQVSTLVDELQVQREIQVKYIRCYNSGENKNIVSYLLDRKLKAKMEFTAPYTSQQNGMVERSFAYIFGNVCETVNKTTLKDYQDPYYGPNALTT